MLCHGSGSVELTGGRKCTGVFLRAADGFMRVHHFGFSANRSKGQSHHQGKAIRADLNGYPLAILSLTRRQGQVDGTMIQSIAEAAQRLRGLVPTRSLGFAWDTSFDQAQDRFIPRRFFGDQTET